MNVPKEIQAFAILLEEIKGQQLPYALTFGISFPYQIATAAAKRYNEQGFTPAFLVADNILGHSSNNDFLFSLKFRHHEQSGSWDLDFDEVQGYVDVIAAYTCWSVMEAEQLWGDVPVSAIFESSPTLNELPDNVRKSALQFAENHSAWARPRMKQNDIIDGRNIMPKLAAFVASGKHSTSYLRGAETAYQTFQLYVLLISATLST